MKNLELKIKKMSETGKLPQKGHPDDACFDIYADLGEQDSITLYAHETVKIKTGFATEIPKGYWGAIFARSGISSKRGLRPVQGVPVIDCNYRGEWIIPLHNDSDTMQTVKHLERIAQFTLMEYPNITLNVVDELDDSDRGENGFGSTGKT